LDCHRARHAVVLEHSVERAVHVAAVVSVWVGVVEPWIRETALAVEVISGSLNGHRDRLMSRSETTREVQCLARWSVWTDRVSASHRERSRGKRLAYGRHTVRYALIGGREV
jgi:hypothetical protein